MKDIEDKDGRRRLDLRVANMRAIMIVLTPRLMRRRIKRAKRRHDARDGWMDGCGDIRFSTPQSVSLPPPSPTEDGFASSLAL